MWEIFRKIGLGSKQAPQSIPVPQRQLKASIDSANRAAGRKELAKLIPTMGSDGSIPMMEKLVLHSDVDVRGDAKRAAAEAIGKCPLAFTGFHEFATSQFSDVPP
jgi:hypothetical protein